MFKCLYDYMILLPKPPKIIDKKENWARFEIEGLYPGYGVTIGNSLRRVLLSSLEGAAVTQVKIKDIQHEFSVIPGVLEDVIHIMINLKKMRFRIYTDEPQKAFLKIKGLPSGKNEREIKGVDFEFPTQVELVNKSCHIATITDKKAELEMEIYLEIATDGTISPQEAFCQAADILVKHFSLFVETFEPFKKEAVGRKESVEDKDKSLESKQKTGEDKEDKEDKRKTKSLEKQKNRAKK